MSQMDQDTLARLRAERAPQIKEARERIKAQGRIFSLIRGHLAQGPDTVPGIAQATGLAPGQVLWHLTALRKYGLAVEGDKQGGYFLYSLTQAQPIPDGDTAGDASQPA